MKKMYLISVMVLSCITFSNCKQAQAENAFVKNSTQAAVAAVETGTAAVAKEAAAAEEVVAAEVAAKAEAAEAAAEVAAAKELAAAEVAAAEVAVEAAAAEVAVEAAAAEVAAEVAAAKELAAAEVAAAEVAAAEVAAEVAAAKEAAAAAEVAAEVAAAASNAEAKIQVAILLDTSNSMDGLINQAKSRLWNIVNTLTTLRFNGKEPEIQIALYEYGNDNLKSSNGYVRQVTPLTTDLDLISEKLFALTTNGGLEYCGTVINKACKGLKWSSNDKDIHLIYIAGNEAFTQGNYSYKEAISDALHKNIFVNTIHCGDRSQGISGMWKDGADKGNGKFFNIDHNVRIRYVATPYDDRIDECNVRLNATYVSYGRVGTAKKASQVAQDKNAESISAANKTDRIVSKSKSVYKNESWDLVDLATTDDKALKEIKQSELPKELQGKSESEINAYVAQKKEERTAIQKEIETLAKQRQEYIDAELKKNGDSTGDDLGKAINQSVLDIALAKGYKTE